MQPGPSEIKKIAAEGILTCLQDAIDALKQGQVPLFGWLFYFLHYIYVPLGPWQWTCALDSGKNGYLIFLALFIFLNLGIQLVSVQLLHIYIYHCSRELQWDFHRIIDKQNNFFKCANLWKVSKILYWISLLHIVFVFICLAKICCGMSITQFFA